MHTQKQHIALPKQLLQCFICNLIYSKPVTLSCGHTFCKECLMNQMLPKIKIQKENQDAQRKQKISVCQICQNIIWKTLPDMRENLVIQNLIHKFYPQEVKGRRGSVDLSNQYMANLIQETGSQQHNKILIRIKQPPILPMPFSNSDIEFQTSFIQDIIDQSKSLVITWKNLQQKKLGLLGVLKKVQSVNVPTNLSKIVFDSNVSPDNLQQKYKGLFLGIHFVTLDSIQVININMSKKLLILNSQQNSQRIVKNLQLCNCSIYHCANENLVSVEQFELFFKVYDNMNNPHYLRQIYSLISDEPFQTRNNPQAMIYCVLRLLKIPGEFRKKLVMLFDDAERMQQINSWLLSCQNKPIDEILCIKVPGKYNPGFVFFIIFMLLAFNLIQDYNK